MKVIITFTFCRNNLWKSKFMALEKPGKLGDFFLLLCGHPVKLSIRWVITVPVSNNDAVSVGDESCCGD